MCLVYDVDFDFDTVGIGTGFDGSVNDEEAEVVGARVEGVEVEGMEEEEVVDVGVEAGA